MKTKKELNTKSFVFSTPELSSECHSPFLSSTLYGRFSVEIKDKFLTILKHVCISRSYIKENIADENRRERCARVKVKEDRNLFKEIKNS